MCDRRTMRKKVTKEIETKNKKIYKLKGEVNVTGNGKSCNFTTESIPSRKKTEECESYLITHCSDTLSESHHPSPFLHHKL